MDLVSYAQSLEALREHPDYVEIIRTAYLDEDTAEAAARFERSEEFQAVKSVLRLPRRTQVSILDVGCGNGVASYSFARLNARVVGVDPDPSARTGLEAAEKLASLNGGRAFEVCRARAEELPFARESFDIVYVRQALHHFEDLQKGVSECARVLRRNGLFLASREHVVSNGAEMEQFLAGHPLHALHGGERAYLDEEYRARLSAAGLRLVEALGPFDSVINHFPISNAEVMDWLRAGLIRRFGRNVSGSLASMRIVQRLYRAKLSDACVTPGRMHSYLCLK